ncbi:MAG: hypothetical protein GY928_08100 [Colwellia sp.]|nr:hypothetical protein [Colwellia sp.]
MENERWVYVEGYNKKYKVSDKGMVKKISKDGKASFLKISVNGKYKRVFLCQNNKCKTIRVHRLMAKCFLDSYRDNLQVDHINGDSMDNDLSNLRMCTNGQNNANRHISVGKTSKYKGVRMRGEKWEASIGAGGKFKYLGLCKNEKDAARLYDTASKALYKEYSCTNKSIFNDL